MDLPANATITVTVPCPACKGSGAAQHPTWADYWAWQQAWREQNPRPPAREALAWQHWNTAAASAMRTFFRERGYDEPPPEEYDCPDCDGEGRIARPVPLADLARQFAGHLATP